MQLVIVNGVIESIHLVTLKGVYEKNNYPLEPREEMPIGSGLWLRMSTCSSKENAFYSHSLNQRVNCFLFSEVI